MFRLIFGVVLFAVSMMGCQEQTAQPLRLRVLSYNIRHGAGMDNKINLQRQAELIRRVNPDLVAFQEVDNQTGRANGVDQVAALGEMSGLHAVFGKAMDYNGGGYGEGVLSRWWFTKVVNHPLPADQGYEPRAMVEAQIKPVEGGPTIHFFGTHLDHVTDAQRIKQAIEINRVIQQYGDAPMILVGDLNARPESATMTELFKQWTNTTPNNEPTFPSTKPRVKIDYVLVRPANRWRVVEIRVIEEPMASDHSPLLVVLELID